MSKVDLGKEIRRLLEMLSPDFDWDEYWEDDGAETIEEVLRKCVKLVPLGTEGDYHDCGSYKAEDTPKGLYRLFYLLEPEGVDFSNMYRGQIIAFTSIDERFLVRVTLYEYELGLFFLAPEETIDRSEAECVPAAWPGADNRIRCTDPDGVDFFEMVRKAVEFEYDVYSVGDFRV
jgi:hypothetical protein